MTYRNEKRWKVIVEHNIRLVRRIRLLGKNVVVRNKNKLIFIERVETYKTRSKLT